VIFALAAPAHAAGPYVLEILEASDGSGFGTVACEYKEGGETVFEEFCPEEFETKKVLKLIPVPEEGSKFVAFENGTGSAAACTGKTKPCSFTLEADSSIAARFDEIVPTLTIQYAGGGEGAVECAEELNSPGLCEDHYAFGTEITLEPEPFEGSEFVAFGNATGSAAVCKGRTRQELVGEPCSLILEEDTTIEAVFEPIMRLLSVKKIDSGSGTVVSEPLGINCGASCSAKFAQGSEILLKASPSLGSTFAGWGGECSGTGFCVVSVEEADVAVTAAFSPLEHKLTVERKGPGTGTVVSSPAGIECGATCSAEYSGGAEVTLAAIPGPSSQAAEWSGCTSVTAENNCKVTMSAAKTITAVFQASSERSPPGGEGEGKARAAATAKVRSSKAQVRLSCAGGPCRGTVRLNAKVLLGGRRKSVLVGKAAFSLADGTARTIEVKLSAPALRELGKGRSLRARTGGRGVLAAAIKLKLAG
jgi:hypothetical protein